MGFEPLCLVVRLQCSHHHGFCTHFLFTKPCNSSSYCSLWFPLRAELFRQKGCCTTQTSLGSFISKISSCNYISKIFFSGLKLLICKIHTERKTHTFLSVNTARELNLTGKALRKEGLGTLKETKGVEMEGFSYSFHSAPWSLSRVHTCFWQWYRTGYFDWRTSGSRGCSWQTLNVVTHIQTEWKDQSRKVCLFGGRYKKMYEEKEIGKYKYSIHSQE